MGYRIDCVGVVLALNVLNVILLGNKEDYKLDLEKSIGNISVDGDNISGNSNIGNGTNQAEIHGGIGAINLRFQEE